MVDSCDDESELYHFGVKGMKWGVRHDKLKERRAQRRARRAELDKPNPKYNKRQRFTDEQVLGKYGVRRINRRMNKGQNHFQAGMTEIGMQVGTGYLAFKAQQFITSPQGQRMARTAMRKVSDFLRSRHGKETVGNALKEIGNKVIIDATVA